jgi:kinesin family protein 6/9
MTGATSNYKQRGLIPRVIEHIFHETQGRPEKSFNISMSYLEIYNETLFDLLGANIGNIVAETSDKATDEDMCIMEESSGNIFVRGLSKHAATDEEDGLSLMFEGEANRAICEHQLNKASTRSHCVFTIYLESRSRVESEGQTILSKLNLVDLAGSERVGKTNSSGTVLKEAMCKYC